MQNNLTVCGAPHRLMFNVYRGLLSRGKISGLEENPVPTFSSDAKNDRSYSSIFCYALLYYTGTTLRFECLGPKN
jgi:hypothetical protein